MNGDHNGCGHPWARCPHPAYAIRQPSQSGDARGYISTVTLDLLHRRIAHLDAYGSRVTVGYNILSQVDQYTDELNNTTQHLYDGRFNYTGTINPTGAKVTVTRDVYSRPVAYTNELGNASQTLYDSYSRPHVSLDAYGNAVTTSFDAYGRVSQEQDEAGSSNWTLYDDLGRYTASQDPMSQMVTTLYDSYGRVNQHLDQLGNSTQYFHDTLNRVYMTQDSMSQTTIQLFDSRGNRAVTIDALSRPVTRTHDALNRLSTQVDLTGDGSVYQYDPVSNLAMEVDATGQVFTYYWDGLSRMTGSLDPTGALSQAVYDRRSSRVATIDAQGRTVTTVYDSLQRPIASINPLGFVYTTVYDAASRVIAQVNPRGYAVSMFYDNLDRQIGTEDQLGYRTSVVFDSRSNLIADVDQLSYRTTYALDTLNRRISTLSPLGYYHTTLYDPRSLAIAGITPLGLIHTTVFDSLQRAIAQITPDAAIWTTIYDPVSNPLAVQTPLNQRTTQVYDARNRVVNTIDPLNRITTTTWDILNRVVTARDQKGQITTHQWDPRSLEINRIYADGTQLTFLYDSLRQLTGVSDHIGLYTMSYDLLDRMLSVNAPGHPNGLPISFGYDENSNRTQMATPWGLFSYGFDPRDQMQVMTDPGYPSASVMGGRTTWTYDPRMLCIRQDNVNLTRTTTTYDADRRLTQQWHYTAANVVIDHVTMTYDANDRPTGKGQFAGVSLFGYDACDRLITEYDPINGRSTLTYDLVGRRVTMTNSTGAYGYQYDFADQMLLQTTPTGSVSYTHDANGSLTVATKPTSRTTYTWDAANRMSSARLPSGQIYTPLYQYDDMRISESAPTGITTFIWNPGGSGAGSGVLSPPRERFGEGAGATTNLPEVLGIINRQVGGTLEQVFAHGTGPTGGSLVRALGTHADASTINRQYHTDNQATVQATTTSTASIEADFQTDSWGNIISGTAADNPYVYQGGLGYWEDTNLTLKYVRARWMDPTTGQWLSVDSVRTEPRYIYVGNTPTAIADAPGTLPDQSNSSYYSAPTGSFMDKAKASPAPPLSAEEHKKINEWFEKWKKEVQRAKKEAAQRKYEAGMRAAEEFIKQPVFSGPISAPAGFYAVDPNPRISEELLWEKLERDTIREIDKQRLRPTDIDWTYVVVSGIKALMITGGTTVLLGFTYAISPAIAGAFVAYGVVYIGCQMYEAVKQRLNEKAKFDELGKGRTSNTAVTIGAGMLQPFGITGLIESVGTYDLVTGQRLTPEQMTQQFSSAVNGAISIASGP